MLRKLSVIAAGAVALRTGNAALDKIIDMLNKMEAEGKASKQQEEVDYSAFSTWCKNTQNEKSNDIKDNYAAIAKFTADAQSASAAATEATDLSAQAADVIATTQADLAKMKAVRQAEAANYTITHQDLTDSIYATQKAIQTLNAVPENAQAVGSFLQKNFVENVAGSSRHKLNSLLELVQAAKDPFVVASGRKSDTIIQMLDGLKEEFTTEQKTLQETESNTRQNYALNKKDGENVIANQKSQKKAQEEIAAASLVSKGEALKSLAGEKAEFQDNREYLSDITADCNLKTKDFGLRQESRAGELKAIAEARSVLESDEVQNGIGHLDNAQSVGAFIQLASKVDPKPDANERVIEFLREKAGAIGSKSLMQLAERAGADPFVKIRKMVSDLIARLEAEAAAQKTKHLKCSEDMKKNEAEMKDAKAQVKKLTATLRQLNANIATHASLIKKLTREIEENRKIQAEAVTARAEDNVENTKVIQESTVAVEAIKQALQVLQNYYDTVSGPVSVLQVKQPKFQAGEYKGLGGDGVLGLLDVVKSQTEALIRETTGAEANAKAAHDKFLTESESSFAKKTSLKNAKEVNLQQLKEDRSDKSTELGEQRSRLDEQVKLKAEVIDPVCTVQGVSFEERDGKRQEEILSLTEALEILNQMSA